MVEYDSKKELTCGNSDGTRLVVKQICVSFFKRFFLLMCELSNNSDDSFAIWEWQVGTQWSAFMPDISSQIEGFYNEGTNPSASSSSVHPNPQILTIGRWAYKIDFNLMCQLNTTTGRRRLIRRQTFTEPQWYGQTEPHLYIR